MPLRQVFSCVSLVLVLGSLLCGVVMNVVVLVTCEFLNGKNDNKIQLGVWRFSVDNESNIFNTDGECENYNDYPEGEDVPRTIRTAQVCSIMAPIFGTVLILLVLMNQCCCKVPCSNIVTTISYTGVHVSTGLIWLMAARNDVCDNIIGGCEWGDGAIINFIAQMLYVFASICHRCLPDPKDRSSSSSSGQQQEKTTTDNKQQPNNNDQEMNRLQNELQQATDRVTQLETEVNQTTNELSDLQKEHDKTKKALATATAATSTAAAAEAVKIKQLNEELDKQKATNQEVTDRVSQLETELKQTTTELSDLQKEYDRTKKALATATAATSTAAAAEAVKIKQLNEELDKQKATNQELQQTQNETQTKVQEMEKALSDLHDEYDKTKAALVTATAATSTAAAAEALKIKQLTEELDKQKQSYEELQQAHNETQEKLDELQTDNDEKEKALVAATATAAGVEAIEITKLKCELDEKTKEMEELQKELEELKNSAMTSKNEDDAIVEDKEDDMVATEEEVGQEIVAEEKEETPKEVREKEEKKGAVSASYKSEEGTEVELEGEHQEENLTKQHRPEDENRFSF